MAPIKKLAPPPAGSPINTPPGAQSPTAGTPSGVTTGDIDLLGLDTTTTPATTSAPYSSPAKAPASTDMDFLADLASSTAPAPSANAAKSATDDFDDFLNELSK